MLSVLIPIYNYNALPLVELLQKQLIKEQFAFEIICLDDASNSSLNPINDKINLLENCSFSVLNDNLGRSAIRNLLAKKAKYSWLLFLDGDVLPVNTNFIRTYIDETKKSRFTVFCGGIKYERNPKTKGLLHVKHGLKNEEISARLRNKKPYKYFFTSNFLIDKDIFKTIKFEEKLTKYGREDFLFALALKNKNFKIHHISNEIYHLGLESDESFVAKTKQAMKNLYFLNQENLISSNETILLKILKLIQTLRISNFIGKLSPYFEDNAIRKKSLFYLNCLKVSYLCHLKVNSEI